MTVAYASLNGPVGWISVFVEERAVLALEWGRSEAAVQGQVWKRRWPNSSAISRASR